MREARGQALLVWAIRWDELVSATYWDELVSATCWDEVVSATCWNELVWATCLCLPRGWIHYKLVLHSPFTYNNHLTAVRGYRMLNYDWTWSLLLSAAAVLGRVVVKSTAQLSPA